MRVLALTKYGRLAASTRYRVEQYLPGLAERGIHVEMRPLFTDAELARRMAGESSGLRDAAVPALRRLSQMRDLRSFDAVWIYLELLPFAPAILERVLSALQVPYVLDLDDAIFHAYDLSPRPLVRRLLGGKMDGVMARAAAVMAGSPYLVERARQHSSRVHHVPTVLDLGRYPPRPERAPEGPLRVGWIGSPSTTRYLEALIPALERAHARAPLELVAIGAQPFDAGRVPLELRPWSESTEVADLHSCDVGIMPLDDSPWSRGKCAFKLIQSMACELPVVASPVGANVEVVTEDVGLLAAGEEAWADALVDLATRPDLGQALGRAGRRRVEARYSLASRLDQVADVFTSL